MESGPESVSSNQSSMNPIINGQIASNSETKESTKASEASSSASSSVSSWSFLSSAKNALISLRDAILNKNSSPTDSLSQLEASTSTSTVTRVAAKDYDKAKSNFDTAKSGLENAKTLAEYETKMADLMAALQDMEANSDPSNDHTEELNNIKKALIPNKFDLIAEEMLLPPSTPVA
ncbi:CHLPN 76 kD protein-like protein [Chlamydia trachomatis]|nr:CHLPN 76 kD protein-like protein [Chlamydia trachomatis]